MARTWQASPYQPDARARVPEPARTRPASRAQKIELVLAATGGQTLDFAGMRSVLHMALPERGLVPTLYLLLFAPGFGPEIAIFSRDCRKLAESAAKNLWVPHRLLSRSIRKFGLWPEVPPDLDLVALVGAGALDRAAAREPIDSANLQNVAQLATEIALRWSKEQRESSGCADSAVATAGP
jgi:hypothetical protein